MEKQKINIIGYGFVGQANAIGFKRLGYDVVAFDIIKKKNIYNVDEFKQIPLTVGKELPESGIHVICIADKNLEDGRQEVGHIAGVVEKLRGKGTIILRTTVLPRLVTGLCFDFYWVEFLRERTAIEDFLNPDLVIVGRRTEEPFPFEKEFPSIQYKTPEEASHIKYLSNIWNAMRISFVNEFGDNLAEEGVEKDNILKTLFRDIKYLKWGNAFGGHCLPKDSIAYINEYPKLLHLKATVNANKIHEEKYPDLESIF